jgi:molybdenum cofactor cytidylyltransferase
MVKIGAVLLAAGSSTRFGAKNKLLAEISDRPLIRLVAETIGQAHYISEFVVVTGYDQRPIERALDGLQLKSAHNPDWASMGSSIAVGASALDSTLDGCFIMPSDMPLVRPALLERLIEKFVPAHERPIVVPVTTSGEQRNPVLWPRRFFGLLTALSGAEGGKRSLKALVPWQTTVRVSDDRVFADIDTTDDLARWNRYSSQRPSTARSE